MRAINGGWRCWICKAGKMNTLTDSLDRWVEEYTWSPDSKRIFFTVDDHGTTPLMMMPVTGGAVRTIAQGPTSIGGVQFTADDKMMIYTEQSGSRPAEINKALSKGGSGVPLTHLNDALFDQYQLTPLEKISVDAGDGSKVESFIVKPSGFQCVREISRSVCDSRRAGRRLGRIVELSLERAGAGRRPGMWWYAESAWIDRLWAELYGRGEWRLGRAGVRRHHGDGGLREQSAVCR